MRTPAIVVLVLSIAGGTRAQEAPPTALLVSAAVSLREALQTIALDFQALATTQTEPQLSCKVELNFGASTALLQQIARGAPVDVLAAADLATINRGVANGWLHPNDPPAHSVFAGGQLVLITRITHSSAAPLQTLAGLRAPHVQRIAIGNPSTVPAGRYTQQALEQAGVWAAVVPKLVRAENVRQVLEYVLRGDAQAGFVYQSDVQALPATTAATLRVVATLAPTPAVQYAAARTVNQSAHRAGSAGSVAAARSRCAERLLRYLHTPAAQAVLVGRGFLPAAAVRE